MLALIFGVVAGAVVGWLGRRGSWTLPLALAVGGVGGSLVAAQVGHLQESSGVLDQLPQDIRSRVSDLVDFTLRSHGFHVVFPVAALLTYLVIVLATSTAGAAGAARDARSPIGTGPSRTDRCGLVRRAGHPEELRRVDGAQLGHQQLLPAQQAHLGAQPGRRVTEFEQGLPLAQAEQDRPGGEVAELGRRRPAGSSWSTLPPVSSASVST